MTQLPLILGAVASGVAFSAIGVAYRLGQTRGVPAGHIAMFLGLGGAVYFGLGALVEPPGRAPAIVWILGALAGISQYVTALCIQASLKRGPLVPVWCAVGVTFLLPVVYAACLLGEPLSAWQVLGLATGVATVLVASFNAAPAESADGSQNSLASPGASRWRNVLLYGLLLLGIVLANGVNQIGMKYLGQVGTDGKNLMAAHGALYFALLYTGLGGLLLVDFLLTRRLMATSRFVLFVGPLAAAGSVVGMVLLGYLVQRLPAATLFTMNATVSILSTAVISALFLGERTRPAWYMTVALAVLTVLLVNLSALG